MTADSIILAHLLYLGILSDLYRFLNARAGLLEKMVTFGWLMENSKIE